MTIPPGKKLVVDRSAAKRDLHDWARRLSDDDTISLEQRLVSLETSDVACGPGSGIRSKTRARQLRVDLDHGISLRIHYDLDGGTVRILAVTDKDTYSIRNATARQIKRRRSTAGKKRA